jgi:hypothetical protein
MLLSATSLRLPTNTFLSLTFAITLLPSLMLKSLGSTSSIELSFAFLTMAFPRGCSENFSLVAAIFNISSVV